MDINSINGANAYNAAISSVNNTQLHGQTPGRSESELETRNTTTEAFEVNITTEARDRLAAVPEPETEETRPETPEDAVNPTPPQPAGNNDPVVDIIA